jgi:hypothetical protein
VREFPAFFPPTPVESARNTTLELLTGQSSCGHSSISSEPKEFGRCRFHFSNIAFSAKSHQLFFFGQKRGGEDMAVSRVSFEPLPRDSQQQPGITLAQLQNPAGDPKSRQRLDVAQKLCAIAATHQETNPVIAKALYLRALDWLAVVDSGVERRGEFESLVLNRLAEICNDPRASNEP